jgi:hypothetical protein
MRDRMEIEGERLKRYRLSYHGDFVGSYATAREALEAHRRYDDAVRPLVDVKGKGRYSIRDRNKQITIADLRRAAARESAP